MKWNPANAYIAFEHAETYKAQGQFEEFRQKTLDAFRYAFRPDQVARCLRNLGYYYVEKGLWEAAVACYERSLAFDPEAKEAISELYYIRDKSGVDFQHNSPEELERLGQQFGFPTEPDSDVIGLAYAYGKHFLEQNNIDGAKYCFQIVYGLTKDERIKYVLEKLPDKQEQE